MNKRRAKIILFKQYGMKKKKNDNLRVYSFSSLSPDSLLFQRVDVHITTQLPSLRKSTLQN